MLKRSCHIMQHDAREAPAEVNGEIVRGGVSRFL